MNRDSAKNIAIIILKIFLTTNALFLLVETMDFPDLSSTRYGASKLAIFFYSILLYIFYRYDQQYKAKSITVLSCLFSFFMVFGKSFMKTNSWDLVFGRNLYIFVSIIVFIGYFLLFKTALNYLYHALAANQFLESRKRVTKVQRLIQCHPFLTSVIIIIICWLPYIISFYPVILSPDPSFQIRQFFGIENKYSEYAILLDENVLITNHHPVIHTVLLGSLAKLGVALGSINVGLFFYSLIQIAILSSVLAYTISYMVKIKTPYWLQYISLCFYAFVPVFPFYAMSAVKDVIFGALIILYIIFLYDIIKHSNERKLSNKQVANAVCLLVLVTLFRNNGIHVIILSFPFLLCIDKTNRKRLALILICTVGLYGGYSKVLLPTLKITPGSVRETLSIPFQQTARYVSEYGDEVTDKEREAIDAVLEYDTLAQRYKPEIADPVKNKYNRFATTEDLKEYFKVWASGLVKHPGVYVQATMNNTYGYFYPNRTKWYIYHKFDDRLVDDGYDYHYNNLSIPRRLLSEIAIVFPKIPIFGFIVNIGFNVWLLFIMLAYFIHKKKYKNSVYLLPALVLLLVCIASPVNTYFRYTLPFVFAMPLMIGMFIDSIRVGGRINE